MLISYINRISVLNAIASVKSLNYEHLFVDLIYRLVDEQKKGTKLDNKINSNSDYFAFP